MLTASSLEQHAAQPCRPRTMEGAEQRHGVAPQAAAGAAAAAIMVDDKWHPWGQRVGQGDEAGARDGADHASAQAQGAALLPELENA